jgi:hypothetical protein
MIVALLSGCGGSASSSGGGGGGGGSATTVTFKFTGGTPTAVAARIGTGAFTAQNPGTLSLSIPSGTTDFAVGYVCTSGSSSGFPGQIQEAEEIVFEASTADGTSFTGPCPGASLSTTTTGTLTASVDASAIPNASILNLAVQNDGLLFEGVLQSPVGNLSALGPVGNDRVEVLAYSSTMQGPLEEELGLVGAKNFTAQAVPGSLNGGETVVLGSSDETTPEPISYSGVPLGYDPPSTIATFNMGNGGGFVLAASAAGQYPAMPAGAIESGDSYFFLSTAHNSANVGETVISLVNSPSGGPVSIAFPAPWAYAGPTPAALPTFNFNYSGFSGMQSASLVWMPSSSAENIFEVNATPSYQNGSAALDFPDLSSRKGFLASPASGTNVTWLAEMVENSAGAFQSASSSATTSAVENSGSFTVP